MSGPTGEHGSHAARMEAIVHGRVQGVGFRVFVLRVARRLGLVGWVANDASGAVTCVAEGPTADLDALRDALRDGPPAAWVDRVVERRLPATGEFQDFDVRTGWHPGD